MSWASDNPEKWDEICHYGIARRLSMALEAWGATFTVGEMEQVADAIQSDDTAAKVYVALMTWANKEIGEAEADYHSSRIDNAPERRRGDQQ